MSGSGLAGILYLHSHDMGRHNQIYEPAIPTPVFDAVADEATVFSNAHSAAPTCSPSRAALLTGVSAHETGMLGLAHRGFRLSHPERHLSHLLRDRGFATALFGVQHETDDVGDLGYDTVWEGAPPAPKADQDLEAARRAARFVDSFDGEQPFFLTVGMQCPHRPYLSAEAALADDVSLPSTLLESPEVRRDFADYIASVRWADRCSGLVVDALKAKGQWDDTLVILTTDHGIAFPFMKGTLTTSGTGVTLAVKLPGQRHRAPADQLVSQLDVLPTIFDVLGSPPPDWFEGRSLLPILKGSREEIHDAVFTGTTFHAAYDPARCVRTKRYAYIHHYGLRHGEVLANIDAGPSKTWYLEHGLATRRRATDELYDLTLDPAEQDNIADQPVALPIKERLQTALHQWQERTEDPLLDGLRGIEITGWVNPDDQVDPDAIHRVDARSQI